MFNKTVIERLRFLELAEKVFEVEKEIYVIERFVGHKVLKDRWIRKDNENVLNIPELAEAYQCAGELRLYIEDILDYLEVQEMNNDKCLEILYELKIRSKHIGDTLDEAMGKLKFREFRVLYDIMKENNDKE